MSNVSQPSSVSSAAHRGVDAIARYFGLERQLALINVAIPAILMTVDGGPIRKSVSAYYDMSEPQFYFAPITATAILFMVNGLIKERNLFNAVLGAALVGVLFFDLDDHAQLHNAFAITFFGGNILMILATSSKMWFRWLTAVGAAVAGLIMWQGGGASTFYAEWVLLAFISAHFFIESWVDPA